MAKGNPNDATKLLNFVAKVYDPKARAWKPVYELPDATNQVHGGVYLLMRSMRQVMRPLVL